MKFQKRLFGKKMHFRLFLSKTGHISAKNEFYQKSVRGLLKLLCSMCVQLLVKRNFLQNLNAIGAFLRLQTLKISRLDKVTFENPARASRCIISMHLQRHWNNASGRHRPKCLAVSSFCANYLPTSNNWGGIHFRFRKN